MALRAHIYHDDGLIAVDLYWDQGREWVAADPDDRDWPIWLYLYWDAEKFERGERDFGGIEVIDVSYIDDRLLADLDSLDLPRVDLPEANLFDASISDVLRWARQTYPSRYTAART